MVTRTIGLVQSDIYIYIYSMVNMAHNFNARGMAQEKAKFFTLKK